MDEQAHPEVDAVSIYSTGQIYNNLSPGKEKPPVGGLSMLLLGSCYSTLHYHSQVALDTPSDATLR